jgi:dihydrolipoamide dehydrogenase
VTNKATAKAAQSSDYAVLVIGSEPGGYVAAIRASQLGLKTAQVESEELRGVRLNWGCTYSRPQIASVGLTENEARDAGHEINVGRFPFQANGKVIALGEAEGMVKVIYDKKVRRTAWRSHAGG